MSPKNDDEIRKLILERRARFVAAALSATGLQACGADSVGPSICLSVVMTPSTEGTASIGGTNGTSTGTNTATTNEPFNTCRNPPACVCLSIAVSYPDPAVNTLPPVSTSTSTASSSTTDGPTGSETSDGDAGAFIDGGYVDGGDPDGGTSSGETSTASVTTDISSTFTEPSVCLSILKHTKK